MWEQQSHRELHDLLHRLHEHGVIIGAICGATLEIARTGLTHNVRHTSNVLAYLQAMVPDYGDEAFYVNEFAVADQNLITANGLGSVEFAREVIKQLNIYSESGADDWYAMFKHGQYVANLA
jgi:putative intracellular protease/amidase